MLIQQPPGFGVEIVLGRKIGANDRLDAGENALLWGLEAGAATVAEGADQGFGQTADLRVGKAHGMGSCEGKKRGFSRHPTGPQKPCQRGNALTITGFAC